MNTVSDAVGTSPVIQFVGSDQSVGSDVLAPVQPLVASGDSKHAEPLFAGPGVTDTLKW
jgi:hypothetical protein